MLLNDASKTRKLYKLHLVLEVSSNVTTYRDWVMWDPGLCLEYLYRSSIILIIMQGGQHYSCFIDEELKAQRV